MNELFTERKLSEKYQPLISDAEIIRCSERAIVENIESLLASKANEVTSPVNQQLHNLIPNVIQFVKVASTIGIVVKIQDSYQSSLRTDATRHVSCLFYVVDSIIDCEEVLWSPAIGFKGNVDVVLGGHIEVRTYEEGLIPVLQNFRDSFHSTSFNSSNYNSLNAPIHCKVISRCVAPLELKTGKWSTWSSNSHRAQIMLYLFMLWLREKNCASKLPDISSHRDVYGDPPNCGVLIYISNESLKVDIVISDWASLRSLVIARNKQAFFLRKSNQASQNALPPLLKSQTQCPSCFQATECMIYHAYRENGNRGSSELPHLFDYSLRGFNKSCHGENYTLWDEFLDLESSTKTDKQFKIWALPSSLAEEHGGHCIGQLIVSSCVWYMPNNKKITPESSSQCAGGTVPGQAQCIRFSRKVNFPEGSERKPVVSLSSGDRVIVSLERVSVSESGDSTILRYVEPNLCAGTICSIDSLCINQENGKQYCVLNLDVVVARVPQRLLGIFKVKLGNHFNTDNADYPVWAPKHWRVRLDADDTTFGVATERTNVLKLFASPHSPNEYRDYTNSRKHAESDTKSVIPATRNIPLKVAGLSRMKSLLIDLAKPEFVTPRDIDVLSPSYKAFNDSDGTFGIETKCNNISACNPSDIRQQFDMLNSGQKAAVEKVVCARDYVLMLGMPGTGYESSFL